MKPYYQEGGITIYHGDCRDVLPTVGPVDVLLMDPPYGLGSSPSAKNNYASFDDDETAVKNLVEFVLSSAEFDRAAMTPGLRMMFKHREPTAVGSYFYPAGSGVCNWGFVGWQPIFYYGKDPFLSDGKGSRMNSWQSSEPAEKNGHPCPKPIKQWSNLLLRVSRPGEVVLDPFMGSGTTMVAAREHGRRAIGIEIEESYCEIAARRLSQSLLF